MIYIHITQQIMISRDGQERKINSTSTQDIISVPASSVPCERAFSGAKHTDTDNRNRLSSEHLGAIQIAKSDMLERRELQREQKEAVKHEKLQQWGKLELGAMG